MHTQYFLIVFVFISWKLNIFLLHYVCTEEDNKQSTKVLNALLKVFHLILLHLIYIYALGNDE